MEHDIAKALEVWTLQNLLDLSIMLGILVCGLAMMQHYYRSVEKHLTLKLSVELWRLWTVLIVDILLAIVVVIGYLVLNTDIMADIKIALPFCPIATILFAIALILRMFHDGHDISSKNYLRSLYLMFAANALNIVGFTLVMEAPSGEYLETHPSPFWAYIKTHLRSNANPHGLELAQVTFLICFPILMAVFVWGGWLALQRVPDRKGDQSSM